MKIPTRFRVNVPYCVRVIENVYMGFLVRSSSKLNTWANCLHSGETREQKADRFLPQVKKPLLSEGSISPL